MIVGLLVISCSKCHLILRVNVLDTKIGIRICVSQGPNCEVTTFPKLQLSCGQYVSNVSKDWNIDMVMVRQSTLM